MCFERTDDIALSVLIQIGGDEISSLHVREQRSRNASGTELTLGKAPERVFLRGRQQATIRLPRCDV